MSRTKKCARRVKRSAEGAAPGPNKKQRKQQAKQRQQELEKEAAVAAASESESAQQEKPCETSRERAEATLAKLLGGMPVADFLREHFEKKPLVVRQADKGELFPKKLFSRARMLKVMSKQSPSMGYGKDLTVCRYVDDKRENFEGDESEGRASSREVASLLDRGYSCQFYQPQRYVDGLFDLNAAFETVFGGLAGASAYLTPANAQALAPHHDDVEVFVLQTQGRKKWKLYHPLVELAGEHSSDLTHDQIGEPSMELTLEEGDLLYFPRGVVHEACTDEEQFSTHVTISVYQHNTWANFLEVALPRVIRQAFDSDVAFRRGLPVGYLSYMGTQFPADSEDAKAFAVMCQSMVSKLAAHVGDKELQEAADEAALDVLANRLPPVDKISKQQDPEENAASPLDSNVSIRFKDRSHVRLSMGEDESKEAFVAVYYSLHNCRRHHMGLCTCEGDEEDNEEEDNEEEAGETSSNDGNNEDNEDGDDASDEDDEGDDLDAAFGQMPPQPKSVMFPGELAQSLLKLYASSNSATGLTVDEIAESAEDETAVRGMLLRLWSEGLLDVTPRS